MRLHRRTVLLGAAGLLTGAAAPGDDGLFHEPWFVESFLDLGEDQAAATDAGRRLAVLWELRGCPLCRRLHETTLADPRVVDAIRSRLDVVLLDIIGARPVTPPDGPPMPERSLARSWGVHGTPTLNVLARPGETLPDAASRIEGYVAPDAMLAWLTALPPAAPV